MYVLPTISKKKTQLKWVMSVKVYSYIDKTVLAGLMSVCLWKSRFYKINSFLRKRTILKCLSESLIGGDLCSKFWHLFEILTFVRNSFQLDISAHKSKAELAHKGTMSLRSRPSSEALRSAVMRRSVSAASNFSSNTVTIKYYLAALTKL
jgi:hypothetical protein